MIDLVTFILSICGAMLLGGMVGYRLARVVYYREQTAQTIEELDW